MSKTNKINMSLLLVLFLSLLLRLVAINQSLWLDEAIGALVVKKYGFAEIISRFLVVDNHPPGYYLLLEAWSRIFGYSEIALRSLSVVFGVGVIYFTFKIAELFSRNRIFDYLALFLTATSPLLIYYSQEARMYMMAAFFTASLFYFLVKTIKNASSLASWVFLSISLLGFVFSDYVTVFALPVFVVVPLLMKPKRDWWIKLFLSVLPTLTAGVFWLPIFAIQLKNGAVFLQILPEWQKVAGGANIKQLVLLWVKFVVGRISFADKYLYYSLVVVFSVPFALSLLKSLKVKEKPRLLWIWVLLPAVIGFLVSIYFPAFIYFRFIYLLPPFYLLISWGVYKSNVFFKPLLISALIIVNLVGWGIYALDKNQHRENWREAVFLVESRLKKGEVAVFTNPEPFAPYQWYGKKLEAAYGATDSVSAHKDATIKKTKAILENKSGVYYFRYLNDLHDPNNYVASTIEDSGFVKGEVLDFVGVGQIYYYKTR